MVSNLIPRVLGPFPSGYSSAVFGAEWDAVVRWWDGVELWLTQLGFALQVVLLMVVLLPTCWWVARILDRVVGVAFDRLGRRAGVDATNDQEPR